MSAAGAGAGAAAGSSRRVDRGIGTSKTSEEPALSASDSAPRTCDPAADRFPSRGGSAGAARVYARPGRVAAQAGPCRRREPNSATDVSFSAGASDVQESALETSVGGVASGQPVEWPTDRFPSRGGSAGAARVYARPGRVAAQAGPCRARPRRNRLSLLPTRHLGLAIRRLD
jgi:hypothetical protein